MWNHDFLHATFSSPCLLSYLHALLVRTIRKGKTVHTLFSRDCGLGFAHGDAGAV
jgi:hypothetical protein